LDQLLAESDYVVCLATATPETSNLMSAKSFEKMKPTAYFINASRGELVNDDDLLKALDSERLAGCALDVGRDPDQFPSRRLALHERVIATPHVGGLTVPAVEHQALDTVAQVVAIANGEAPKNAVNLDRASRFERYAMNLNKVSKQ
jgi:D-3-phosphoglycerate dehydrogenase / 2-oxoglutarate reductase